MACECIHKVDQLLEPHNTRLQLLILFSGPVSEMPYIGTEQIEKGRGKPKAKTMFPSFCPFCGTKYEAVQPPSELVMPDNTLNDIGADNEAARDDEFNTWGEDDQ